MMIQAKPDQKRIHYPLLSRKLSQLSNTSNQTQQNLPVLYLVFFVLIEKQTDSLRTPIELGMKKQGHKY